VGRFGCQPQNIIAVIGPAIGPCCYQVGPEVITAAAESLAGHATLFEQRNGDHRYAYFNLGEANRRQLAAAGVKQIIQTDICTACQTDEFFSHRAEKGRTGRFGVIIGVRGQEPNERDYRQYRGGATADRGGGPARRAQPG
jgi:copper oxidase (laccase) domain-containing protein